MSHNESCPHLIVNFLDGSRETCVTSGSGIQWKCRCSDYVSFSSKDTFEVTGGVRVNCDRCGRKYFSHLRPPVDDGDEIFEVE